MAVNPLRGESARDNRYTQFRAALLRPLADTAEPVESRAFARELRKDAKTVWHAGMRHVHRSDALRDLCRWDRLIGFKEGAPEADQARLDQACDRAEIAHWHQVDRQMRLPAPNREAITWKWRLLPYLGGHPDWPALVEADEARIPPRPATRRRAGA